MYVAEDDSNIMAEAAEKDDNNNAPKKKEKEEKPPPAVGPGSLIRGLAAPLRKHLPRDEKGVTIAFSTSGMKALPLEVNIDQLNFHDLHCNIYTMYKNLVLDHIRGLVAPLRKHLPGDEKGVPIAFSTSNMKALPLEVNTLCRTSKCSTFLIIRDLTSRLADHYRRKKG